MNYEDLKWLAKQKACPACFGEAIIVDEEFDDGDVWYRPECSCCKLGWQENYLTVKEAVEAWNSVDARPVTHAMWEQVCRFNPDGEVVDWFRCSECYEDAPIDRYGQIYFSSHCPRCGSRMDLKNGISRKDKSVSFKELSKLNQERIRKIRESEGKDE